MRWKIYLVEDNVREMGELVNKLNEYANKRNDANGEFIFEALNGTVPGEWEGTKRLYYDESVRDIIDAKREEVEDESTRMGLLLDIMLAEEDLKSAKERTYPQVNLAKKIFFDWCKDMPIYIVTNIPTFENTCELIMGADLGEQSITKSSILKYCLEEDIDDLFNYFKKFQEERI